MKMAIFSVVFAVLASGCAMGAEGPEECGSGSCTEASFELSKSDSAKLAGTWTGADGKHSLELSENGYCQLDEVPCVYTVRATAPEGEGPWAMELTLVSGQHQSFEIELVAKDALIAKHGNTFDDYTKTLPTKKPMPKAQKPSEATFDAIQPFGRSHH